MSQWDSWGFMGSEKSGTGTVKPDKRSTADHKDWMRQSGNCDTRIQGVPQGWKNDGILSK